MDAAFEVHTLNDQGRAKARVVAGIFDKTLRELTAVGGVPVGRELALVRTHLETACLFATKALASREENREP